MPFGDSCPLISIKEVVMSKPHQFGVSASYEQVALFDNVETEFSAVWTEPEILQLQRGMLIHAIQEVRDKRRSEYMRKDAWEWLMSDEDHPFCSARCAENNGYNIKYLRWLIKHLVTDI